LIEGKIFFSRSAAAEKRKITQIFINQSAGLFRGNLREILFWHIQFKEPLSYWAVGLGCGDLAARPS
jgi:hypothetical protein